MLQKIIINRIKMKKILFISMLLILCISNAAAQKTAEIKFDKQTYNFGKFSESNPVQKCTFNFTNVGDAPLVINQAMSFYPEVRTQTNEGSYFNSGSTNTGVPDSMPPTYPTHRVPKFNAKL